MTDTFFAQIGPATVRVIGDGPLNARLRDHLDEFIVPAGALANECFVLVVAPGRPHGIGRRLRLPSREVAIEWLDSMPPIGVVSGRLTVRAAMRFAKRYPDIVNWQRGRWLLFLRHAFELPLLAALDYHHGFVPVHAATVFGSKGAVLILGHNGAGKSTLACRLSENVGVELAADNFSPSDGTRVLCFPGAPKPKPGSSLPAVRPERGSVDVRGVVSVGLDLGDTRPQRLRGLRSYLQHDHEAHRGTVWGTVFGDGKSRTAKNDQSAAETLSKLPSLNYEWRGGSYGEVEKFVREHCGA